MSENRRYYWLKLQETFFEDDTIDFIESQENGEKYVLFYLKLCLKALKNEGKLIRYVGELLMPYDEPGIAKLTNTDIDTVRSALILFSNIGLIKRLETGELYLTQINEMIGTETSAAQRKRKQRIREKSVQKIECENVTPMSQIGHTDIDIEKELDKDKELDKETEITDGVQMYNECTDINTNSNTDNKPNIEKEKSQKPSLLQREPKNDLEVIEKEYLLNYQYLYKKGFVKSEKPVNDWLQSRRNTNNAINQYGLDLVLKAVKNSKLDQFCINCGYKLTTIISTGVLSRLINGKVERINIANDEINISEEDIPF